VQDLTVRQLLDLTTAEVPDAADHLKQAFEWHFERSMTAVKLFFGVAGSLLIWRRFGRSTVLGGGGSSP